MTDYEEYVNFATKAVEALQYEFAFCNECNHYGRDEPCNKCVRGGIVDGECNDYFSPIRQLLIKKYIESLVYEDTLGNEFIEGYNAALNDLLDFIKK